MGKVKNIPVLPVLRAYSVSIPYGKGKGEKENYLPKKTTHVSIPYGKGKGDLLNTKLKLPRYQFPMGKVKNNI